MSNLSNYEILSIDCLFAFLSHRRHRFYDNLSTTAFNFLKSAEYSQINKEILKFSNNEKLTDKNLSNVLLKIFTTFDPMKLGHQAINIILDIRKYKSKIPFLKNDKNQELQKFCDETIISNEHVNCSIFLNNTTLIVPETQINNNPNVNNIFNSTPIEVTSVQNQLLTDNLSQTEISSENLNSILQYIFKEISYKIDSNNDNLDKNLLEKMSSMLKEHKKQTTPSEIKDQYYVELKKT